MAISAVAFERRPDDPMYPASTTKILTAIVAIESGRLDETVTIQRSDIEVQPSILGLRVGERIQLRDLVYGLMLRSGNDAAMAIARHVGGTRPRFYDMMNEKAREIGCTGTHFTNPHGLPDRSHYTTARDLGRITLNPLKHLDPVGSLLFPVLLAFSGLPSIADALTEEGQLASRESL